METATFAMRDLERSLGRVAAVLGRARTTIGFWRRELEELRGR